MTISAIPILSMLRTRMHWHQERQRLLAENVANADTPRFRPSDLAQPKLDRAQPQAAAPAVVALARTSDAHIAGTGLSNAAQFATNRKEGPFEVRPMGNGVTLEDQMLKVAANQMDYQAASALYARSLALIKTALGR
jgi:flagellar basal-body rod protein FlgB